MTTTVNKTLKHDGSGDYTLWSVWESDIPADISTATGLDEHHTLTCYDGFVGGLNDNLLLISSGHITDETGRISITVDIDSRHNFTKTGFYSTGYISITGVFVDIEYVRLTGDTNSRGAKLDLENATNQSEYYYLYIHDSSANGVEVNTSTKCHINYSLLENLNRAVDSDNATGGDNLINNCIAIGCNAYVFIRAVFRNCIVYGGTNQYYQTLSGSSNNASSDTSGDVVSITSIEFQDYVGGDYRLAYDSQLRDAGTNLILSSDLPSPQYDINGDQWTDTGVWDIGFNYVFKIRRAIRTAAAWVANQTEMEAMYGKDNYHSLLSTWESDLPPDLTVVDEQQVAEGYADDWGYGVGILKEDAVKILFNSISSATNKIILTAAVGSRNLGVIHSGFEYRLTGYKPDFIINSRYMEIHDLTFSYDDDNYNLSELITSNALDVTLKNCILIDMGIDTGLSGFRGTTYTSSISNIAINCMAVDFHQNGFYAGYHAEGTATYNCISINCGIGFSAERALDPLHTKNCIAYNCTTDYLFLNVSSETNATTGDGTSDPSITVINLSQLDGVDFTSPSTGDYNLTPKSVLHGAGIDLGYTSDIVGKTYRTFNAINYIPIGAFIGISKFTALRIDQTAFDTLTALEQARYEGNWNSLLSTWEANASSDLIADNIQEVIECFNDWVDGLEDTLTLGGHVCEEDNNLVVQSASSDGTNGSSHHNGVIDSGFRLKSLLNLAALNVRITYANISGIQIGTVSTYGTRFCISVQTDSGANFTEIHACIFKHFSGGVDDSRGMQLDYSHYFKHLYVYNNIFIGLTNGIFSGYKSTAIGGGHISNNTFVSCLSGIESGTVGDDSITPATLHNNVFLNCTKEVDANLNFGAALSNATSNPDTGQQLISIFNVSTTDGVDFTSPSTDDYSIPTGSVLIDAGTDLSTEFTDDIVGTERG